MISPIDCAHKEKSNGPRRKLSLNAIAVSATVDKISLTCYVGITVPHDPAVVVVW